MRFESMNCAPGADASCSTNVEVSGPKTAGACAVVMASYDALTPARNQLQAAGLRLRFGVVPCSSTVNVGKLVYAISTGYICNPAPYQQQVCTSSYTSRAVTYRSGDRLRFEFHGRIRVAGGAAGHQA